MRAAWVLLCAGSAACLAELPVLDDPCGAWPEPGLFRVTLDQPEGGDRRPHVYVPGGEGPRDIVVLLHGGGMSGPKMEEITGFEDLADRDRFVLVYPNGLGWPTRIWNAGQDRPGEDQDDVTFLDGLARVVSDRVCGGRVLATGFSNGSMMAQRWACEGKTPPDAVAGASGPLLLDRCDGDPLPIRYYHGVEDPIVPYEGGIERGVTFPPVEEAFSLWRERNRCEGEGDPIRRGDTACTAWSCDASTVLCSIDGWRHMWPGGIHGDQTSADATGEIWTWFRGLDPVGAADPDPTE
jgi:polyhydroxybutyrate depolymerase